MLGRAANGVYWMARYLERAENTARLLNVGFRLAMTHGVEEQPEEEWRSVLDTTGHYEGYRQNYDEISGPQVCNYILRDQENPLSVLKMIEEARTNARMVRNTITSEVWEATNESWMTLSDAMARPVRETNLGDVLASIRRQTTLVRGAIEGSMLRNDVFNFSRLGTFIERADNTARILDIKYYVLLPSAVHVGSQFDNAQWDTLLRSVAGDRAYRWMAKGDMDARSIASFLILDSQFPRSLLFCSNKIRSNLRGLALQYGEETGAHEMMRDAGSRLNQLTIADIMDSGLHEFLTKFISETGRIGGEIATAYRFVE